MTKQQIIALCTILGLSLIGLIFMQASYFQTAFQLKKAQFDFTVNKSISEVIETLEKNDRTIRLMSQPEERVAATNLSDSTFGNAHPSLKERFDVLVEYEANEHLTSHQNAVDLFNLKDENSIQRSICRSRQAMRERRSKIHDNYESNITEESLSTRLRDYDLVSLLGERLKNNGITNPFEYAVKENKQFVISSANFVNSYSDYNYCKSLYFGNIEPMGSLHVNFPNMSHGIWASVLLLSPSLIITVILILCFAFCIAVIIKQKKLSAIKNDFINNMTHEFKTPIATISLASQMLKDGSVDNSPDSVVRIAGIINDESKRLTFQVEKVLQTALFTETRMKMKFKKMNLNPLVEGMVQKFSLRVEDKGGQISVHLDAEMDEVMADELHMSNVLSNLLDNAIKYCNKVPEICVYTRNKKDNIVISVIDNGIGIASNEQKMIFERFYRVSTGNLHDVKGFGLGLSYVKTIVDAHGGRIEVVSSEGKGSRFDIILPLKHKKLKVNRTLFF